MGTNDKDIKNAAWEKQSAGAKAGEKPSGEPGLKREDFEESCCCCSSSCSTIPSDRVIDRLDKYLASDDYAGAERHLLYWIGEAESGGDGNGLLLLLNECIGLYRKIGEGEKSLEYAARAIKLAERLGLEDTVVMGTTFINVATAHCACGSYDKALPYYEKASELYAGLLPPTDPRMGGLYNNYALAVMETGDIAKAAELYNKALDVMKDVEGGEPNMAITYCNLADLAAREYGEVDGERYINEYLEKAWELLDGVSDRRDGAYAYACEKCAPAFGHYGFFLYEDALIKRSRSIYEGN